MDASAATVASSQPFDDPQREADYAVARNRFVSPTAAQGNGVVLAVTLGLFVAADLASGQSLERLVILVGVLLFHELGHYVGMIGLGYRDVRMFFIPFFGAAVAGRPGGGSQTREAIVLLLGPVPGIAFGFSAALAAVIFHSPTLKTIASYLIGVNALNLLPVMPFDGGRLASVLLFSRWRWTEGLFTAVTLALVAVVAFAAGAPLFGTFAVFYLLVVPARVRMSRVAGRVGEHCGLNAPAALDEPSTRALFAAVREAIPKANAKVVGDWMIQVLEIGSRRAPSVGRSLAIAAVWGVSLLVAFVGVAVAVAAK